MGGEGDVAGVKRNAGSELSEKREGLGSVGGITVDGGKGGGTAIVGEGAESEKGLTVDTRNGRL